MAKAKVSKVRKKPTPEIGDFVEVELIDSGATWNRSLESPGQLALSKLSFSGILVRQDSELTVLDSGGVVEDENYPGRRNYHIAWTPAITDGGIKLIRRCRKNRR